MDNDKLNVYFFKYAKYFELDKLLFIREKLELLPNDQYGSLEKFSLRFINPASITVLSIFLGATGIDRFILGDVGWGILKFFTFGGLGIFTIIDWFLISDRARKVNFSKMNELLEMVKSDVPLSLN